MAGVLAAGPGATLSHRSAGALRQIRALPSGHPLVEITAPTQRRRPGLEIHHAWLAADEREVRDRIPVTSLMRTLVDLAGVLDEFALERALAEAEFRYRSRMRELPQALERYRGRRGVGRLRKLADTGVHRLGITRSPLEVSFLRFLDAHGMRRPELNVPLIIGDRRVLVDCLWREERIALELDGRPSHLRERTFDSDRARDLKLTGLGLKPLRVTAARFEDRAELAADLLAAGVPPRRGRRTGLPSSTSSSSASA